MICESCREMLEVEGIEPECDRCPVPPVTIQGQRILKIRARLVQLHELVDGGTILRLYEVTREELELLAVVEGEIRGGEKPTEPLQVQQ